eukprot:130811-Rhodomonas_salina.2
MQLFCAYLKQIPTRAPLVDFHFDAVPSASSASARCFCDADCSMRGVEVHGVWCSMLRKLWGVECSLLGC